MCALSVLSDSAALWTVAGQVPLPKEFFRQFSRQFSRIFLEWVTISSPGRSSHPRIKPKPLVSPAWTGEFFTTEPPGKPRLRWVTIISDSSEG